MKGKNPIKWLGIGAGAVALLLISVFFVSSQNYSRSVAESGGGAPVSIFIQNPQPGSQFELGSLANIHAKASGPSPVVAIELWADGQLLEVQSTDSPDGLLQFQGNFTWPAETIGEHFLFARAIDGMGQSASSALLPLLVVGKGEVTEDEANSAYIQTGSTVPASLFPQGGQTFFSPSEFGDDAPPAYQPVDPGDSLPNQPAESGSPWSLTLGTWFKNLFGPTPGFPPPPAIPASAVEVCRPRIWISDNSENEDGFYVYRRDPGMASFIKIETLAAHVGAIFTFEDANLYGSYQYYVSAFNGAGEAASNIETVDVDSENCKPEIPDGLVLDLASLFAGEPTEMGYCYYTMDGIHWQRHPAAPQGFMDTALGGPDTFETKLVLIDSGESTPLSLDCWGWFGGELENVGKWEYDNMTAENLDDIEFEQLDNPSDFVIGLDNAQFDIPFYDLRVPVPIVSLGSGPDGCADHAGGNFLFILVCADIADDLDYAVWDLGPCLAQLCFNESSIVGYNVYDSLHDNGQTPAHTADHPISIYFMINDQSCDPRNVRVSALAEIDGVIHESFPSNNVFYNGNPNCPFLFGQETRTYRITLDTIDFSVGDINDDPDVEDDAEGKGFVSLWTESNEGKSFTLNLFPEFDDDVPPNPYSWAGLPLCQGFGYQTFCSTQNLFELLGMNSQTFEMLYLEWAHITVALYDQDDETADDPICVPNQSFWFNQNHIDTAPNQSLSGSLSANHPDGDCVVTFHIELVP